MKAATIEMAYFENERYLFPLSKRSQNPLADYKKDMIQESLLKAVDKQIRDIKEESKEKPVKG